MGWFSRKPSQEKLLEELASKKEMLRLLEDPATIFQFGLMAFDGDGQEQDYCEAASWFKLAAEQGHSGAQHNLALMYEEGLGVEQDYEQAFEWYVKSANQGNAGSQNNLGVAYLKGQGVEQNDAEAATWIHKAAEQNLASAQYYLGLLYSLGKGVQKTPKIAKKWLQSAATQGIVEAEELIKDLFDEIKSEITDVESQMEDFVNKATSVMYSTETDIFKALETKLLAKLDKLDLLIAYIAISVASSTRYQIRTIDIEIALERKLYPKLHELQELSTSDGLAEFLELYKQEAIINVTKLEIDFLIGKTAYESAPNSYSGILYNTAREKMRPLSPEERQEARILAERFAAMG